MIEIGIDPVLINIGPFELRWYGIFVALAVVVGVLVPLLLARREGAGITRSQVYAVAPWAVVGGIIGSKLVHVIDQWAYYAASPGAIFDFQGASIYGAILGGVLAGVLYARVSGIPVGRLADLVALGLPLAQAVGRIGCTINGCCYGKATSLPWGFVWTHSDTYAPQGVVVHPTQDYELLWDLLIFAVLWKLRPRLKPPGALFLGYLSLYPLGRFLITYLRINDPFLLGLKQAQVISVLVLAVAVPWLVYLLRRRAPDLTGDRC